MISELLENGCYKKLDHCSTDSEADFVAMMNGDISYYQAAETALAAETVSRELTPLQKIADNYPKYLLTLDELFGETSYEKSSLN